MCLLSHWNIVYLRKSNALENHVLWTAISQEGDSLFIVLQHECSESIVGDVIELNYNKCWSTLFELRHCKCQTWGRSLRPIFPLDPKQVTLQYQNSHKEAYTRSSCPPCPRNSNGYVQHTPVLQHCKTNIKQIRHTKVYTFTLTISNRLLSSRWILEARLHTIGATKVTQ